MAVLMTGETPLRDHQTHPRRLRRLPRTPSSQNGQSNIPHAVTKSPLHPPCRLQNLPAAIVTTMILAQREARCPLVIPRHRAASGLDQHGRPRAPRTSTATHTGSASTVTRATIESSGNPCVLQALIRRAPLLPQVASRPLAMRSSSRRSRPKRPLSASSTPCLRTKRLPSRACSTGRATARPLCVPTPPSFQSECGLRPVTTFAEVVLTHTAEKYCRIISSTTTGSPLFGS